MELEFDKEIDALLRKAKRDSPAAIGVAGSTAHLDADELAAFAENALPDRTRAFYITHLADCDTCRKTFAGFIAMNPEAAADAASVSAEPLIASKLPWYKRLFAMPNLAYMMGALVVMFSGIIGVLVYQNQMSSGSMQTARATKQEPVIAREPNEEPQTFSNASSSSNSNAAASSPVQDVTKSGVEVGSAGTGTTSSNSMIGDSPTANPATAQPKALEENKPVDTASGGSLLPEAPVKQPAVAAAPPQTVVKEKDAENRRELDDKKTLAKTEQAEISRNDELSKTDAQNQNNISRDASPGANSAKMRAVGPRQVQSQTQSNQVTIDGADASIAGRAISNLKTAGGKKFEFRDGVWYDTAYTGQGKKDVKRGTDKYIRLDTGLRSIADQIGGTVVVVWNGQAYKIK